MARASAEPISAASSNHGFLDAANGALEHIAAGAVIGVLRRPSQPRSVSSANHVEALGDIGCRSICLAGVGQHRGVHGAGDGGLFDHGAVKARVQPVDERAQAERVVDQGAQDRCPSALRRVESSSEASSRPDWTRKFSKGGLVLDVLHRLAAGHL